MRQERARTRIREDEPFVSRQRADKRRKDKLAKLPGLVLEAEGLRACLRAHLMFEEALPGPGMPKRKDPPHQLSQADRTRFMQNELGRYKTAMAKWLPDELARLRKHAEIAKGLSQWDSEHVSD